MPASTNHFLDLVSASKSPTGDTGLRQDLHPNVGIPLYHRGSWTIILRYEVKHELSYALSQIVQKSWKEARSK